MPAGIARLLIFFLIKLFHDFFYRKFDKQVGNFSDEQKALATMVRITAEEYLYW